MRGDPPTHTRVCILPDSAHLTDHRCSALERVLRRRRAPPQVAAPCPTRVGGRGAGEGAEPGWPRFAGHNPGDGLRNSTPGAYGGWQGVDGSGQAGRARSNRGAGRGLQGVRLKTRLGVQQALGCSPPRRSAPGKGLGGAEEGEGGAARCGAEQEQEGARAGGRRGSSGEGEARTAAERVQDLPGGVGTPAPKVSPLPGRRQRARGLLPRGPRRWAALGTAGPAGAAAHPSPPARGSQRYPRGPRAWAPPGRQVASGWDWQQMPACCF